MSSDIRALALRWFEEVWNRRNDAAIDALMAPHSEGRLEGMDGVLTVDDFKRYRRAYLNAVPDLETRVRSVTVEGDRACIEWRLLGTHLGHGLGIPPSGRPVDFSGVTVFEYEHGRIVRGFDRWNRGEMIASLMRIRMDELQAQAGLTPRESQVALLMAERLAHTEIAAQLGISANTARRHCERILQKLGVSSRLDVASAIGRIPGSVLARHGSDLESAAGGPGVAGVG